MRSAVCLTGLERSFVEIGGNIREAVSLLLGENITYFGVRPRIAGWHMVRAMLPFETVEPQTACHNSSTMDLTFKWFHCDMRLRAGDCRRSFLQALCDLDKCEGMISAYERRAGVAFDAVLRLRPDLFWEASIQLGELLPHTVYVPRMDTPPGTYNDHLGYGASPPSTTTQTSQL